MVGGSRRTASSSSNTALKETTSVKHGIGDDSVIVLDDDDEFLESEIAKLRGRWEFASVLNFLTVFEAVIGSDLKLTADEIEMGLIKPNTLLAQLHITLLKGIPPVSKTLNVSGTWVTVLCKKLAMWWPWVAEGEIPLTAANGKEITRYKELDPTNRLLILKALCEIRADQDDTVSYVNDSLKQGTQISCFRKDKIGGHGNGTSYWYDGNTIIGYRLYRQVNKTETKSKMKGKACLSLPAICFQWETLATNLEEFRKVTDELSSSKVVAEVSLGKTIGSDAIPVIEKFQKKKERALKQRQRKEALLNGFRNAYDGGITRSCRSRRPVNYTFDEYDRAIDEAIQINKKSKTFNEQRQESKHVMQGKIASNGISDMGTDSEDSSGKRGDSKDSEAGNDVVDIDDDYDSKEDDVSKEDDNNDNGSEWEISDEEQDNHSNRKQAAHIAQKPVGLRWSERLAGGTSHPVVETRNLGAKNRLRQRPTRNSALESVVLDSDDENSSEHTNSGISGQENCSVVADSEDASDS